MQGNHRGSDRQDEGNYLIKTKENKCNEKSADGKDAMANILKGAPVAKAIQENLKKEVDALKQKGITPTLALLRIGQKEDDIAYEKSIEKRFAAIGISLIKKVFDEDAAKEEVLLFVDEVNENADIHGMLVFRPFADKALEREVALRLDPRKDVDGMTDGSLARVLSGQGDGFYPCTAEACLKLLDYYDCAISGKEAVVIGRSLVIGKPVAMGLMEKNATVTVCHTKTKDIETVSQRADILIACAGKPRVIGKDYVRAGQVIVDVGIHVDEDGSLMGDVDFDNVEPIVSAISPVPAGVGSVTTAVLAEHVVSACKSMQLSSVV